MTLAERLHELAKVSGAVTPVVSVYLNTRWSDEHQRDRTRVFLRTELRRAREGARGPGLDEALAWVEAQGDALVGQARLANAPGVALFAGGTPTLREVVPVTVPFEEAFVVADAPFLRPLASLVDRVPSTLVVFVDGESARLYPLYPDGPGDEVRLSSVVPGQHRRGGWAQLAQSRYQRHIEAQRGRHFEAVAEALAQLAEGNGVERVVVAGEPGTVAAFRKVLPLRLATRVTATVPAARYEATARLVARAVEAVRRLEADETAAALGLVLTEAAKGGQATAGLGETLEAVVRGAVQRLFLGRAFREAGGACAGCGALQAGAGPACRLCGQPVQAVELGEAMVGRVLAAGGAVTSLEAHVGLDRVGGVAARLRYPL